MMQRVGLAIGRTSNPMLLRQTRTLFTPIPISIEFRSSSCCEPLFSRETFHRHYFDIYIPLFKKLNTLVSESEHTNEKSLLNLLRKTLDSPGEIELYNVAANVHNHDLFFENLENQYKVDYEKMSEASKQKITDNFTTMENLQYEFLCHVEAMYGSGWVWLIDRRGLLEVVSTHDSYSVEATSESVTTLLALDMWEHSFWKDFGTSKEKYVAAFWRNVNWEVVDKRMQQADINNKNAAQILL